MDVRRTLSDRAGRTLRTLTLPLIGLLVGLSAAAAVAQISGGTIVAILQGSNGGTLLSDTSNRLISVGAGVAGTPAGGVISMQGVAGGTAVPVNATLQAGSAVAGKFSSDQTTPGTTDLFHGLVCDRTTTTQCGAVNTNNEQIVQSKLAGVAVAITNIQALASAGGTTTFRTGAGRFFGVDVTAAGTAATNCYDNTAASGTKLLATPATTVVGTLYPQNVPAGGIPFATGLTCDGAASSAALTVLWAQ